MARKQLAVMPKTKRGVKKARKTMMTKMPKNMMDMMYDKPKKKGGKKKGSY